MDNILRPERLETDPNSGEASKEWIHWKRTFDNFLAVLPQTGLNKLSVLANFVSPSSSGPEPQPELAPVPDMEPAPVRRSQ